MTSRIPTDMVADRTSKAKLSDTLGSIQTSINTNTSSLADSSQQLQDISYNVKHPPTPLVAAKGDSSTDDSTAIQNIINQAITTGGTVYFPKGTYKISSSIVANTSNGGKKLTIKGAGLGVTVFSVTQDIDAFQVNGYLVELTNFSIVGISGSTHSGIHVLSSGSAGRLDFNYLQVTTFKNGFQMDDSFDQMWIDKCNFSSNTQYGIFINELVSGGGALLDITHCITNNNGVHGVYVTTSSIYGHVTIRHLEAIANGQMGLNITGPNSTSMFSVFLENIDIESVPATASNNSALYMKYVRKFTIIGGQYSIASGQTAFASIWLDYCGTGMIHHPWIRNANDGQGVATNPIYVSNGATQIYMFGANIGSVPFDFSFDGVTDPATCINMDLVTTNKNQLEFIPAPMFSLAQGTPSPTQSVISHNNVWQFEKSGVTTSQAVAISLKPYIRKVKSITLYWWNETTGTGNVSWQLALRSYTVGQTETTAQYVNANTAANSQYILQKTTVTTPSWTSSDIANLWIIRNYTDVGDTLAGNADLIGVQINFQ